MDKTEVVFDNIEQRIMKEISNAHYAIFVSVAWFTNKRLFQALVSKAKENCYVSIIIQLDEINSQSGIDFNEIKIGRSECFVIPKDSELIHDKFCIIDFQKVITGSYNWTYKASHNSENILILSDPAIASQYISRFEQQKANKGVVSSIIQSKNATISTTVSTLNTVNSVQSQPIAVKKVEPIKHECQYCNKELNVEDKYCWACGRQQSSTAVKYRQICTQCHKTQPDTFIDAQSRFCIYCGAEKLLITT